jgi:4-amino-4-deoxy-L-arabinose transferase-like glycosyltransferase
MIGGWRFALVALLVLGAGLGLRDPWPPDEPRFAMIAADMAAGGDWLFPHAGPFLYADKPPLFVWLTAIALTAGLPVTVAPWLPGLAGCLLTLVCVVHLATRLWGRRTGQAAGFCLLAAAQFPLQAQSAQLDATVLGCTTLGLYGLLRVLLLGGGAGWLALAGLAMGAGVLTKGVGFLPLLLLIPAWLLGRRGALPGWRGGAGWLLLPLGLLLPVGLWAVAVLWTAWQSGDPALAAYARNIFLGQTAGRYVAAEHHHQHPFYFLVEVIPTLWMPLAALLPWLLPAWWRRRRDPRFALPLLWVVAVLLFFSGSSGKRGVYILPALPALALAAGPLVPALLRRRGVQRLARWGLTLVAVGVLGGVGVVFAQPSLIERHNDALDELPSLLLPSLGGVALGLAALAAVWAWRRPAAAPRLVLGLLLLGVAGQGWLLRPALDPALSARGFMARVGQRAAGQELGMVAWKEQMWLFRPGPVTVFAHRPRSDAARHAELAGGLGWLAADARRRLLIPADLVVPAGHPALIERRDGDALGRRHREDWLLIDAAQLNEAGRIFVRNAAPEAAPPATSGCLADHD